MDLSQTLLRDLVKCLSGASFQWTQNRPGALEELLQDSGREILPLLRDEMLSFRQTETLQPGYVYDIHIPGTVYFLLSFNQERNQLFLMGPALSEAYSPETVTRQMQKLGFSPEQIRPFCQFCQTLPVVSPQTLLKALELLLQHLTGHPLPLPIERLEYPRRPAGTAVFPTLEPGETIRQMRQVEQRYENISALTEAVKLGNTSLALHFLGQFQGNRDRAIRNPNPLRNIQNYCIILNSQLRYALEGSGIHPYHLDAFSNEIALAIEQLSSVKKAETFIFETIRGYCKLVQEHTYPGISHLALLAVTYIKGHLDDTLTVKDTAEFLTVNANYLSTVFHREMGLSFTAFVNRERARQAEGLLRSTNLQIQEIASAVGYNHSGYFARQFAHFFGKSPRQYRETARQ